MSAPSFCVAHAVGARFPVSTLEAAAQAKALGSRGASAETCQSISAAPPAGLFPTHRCAEIQGRDTATHLCAFLPSYRRSPVPPSLPPSASRPCVAPFAGGGGTDRGCELLRGRGGGGDRLSHRTTHVLGPRLLGQGAAECPQQALGLGLGLAPRYTILTRFRCSTGPLLVSAAPQAIPGSCF